MIPMGLDFCYLRCRIEILPLFAVDVFLSAHELTVTIHSFALPLVPNEYGLSSNMVDEFVLHIFLFFRALEENSHCRIIFL